MVLSFCTILELFSTWRSCRQLMMIVETYASSVRCIDHCVHTNYFHWILKRYTNIRKPPVFAFGPKLTLSQSLMLYARFENVKHLEICNMYDCDALALLFSLQTFESCRINADLFSRTRRRILLLEKKPNRIKCKTVCIYSSDNADLCFLLRLFCEIENLVLCNGTMYSTNFNLKCNNATLMNILPICDSTSLKKLFENVKYSFQMNNFHTCNSSCRLIYKFLKCEKAPKYIVMNNFPNCLKEHFLKLGSCIGGSSLPDETPINIPLRTNFAFVLPSILSFHCL